MNFQENLQKLRKEHAMSQEQLAEELGVTRQSVSKWEAGQSYPDIDKLSNICDVFDCSLDDLIKGDVTEEKEEKQKNLNHFGKTFVNNVKKLLIKLITKLKKLFHYIFKILMWLILSTIAMCFIGFIIVFVWMFILFIQGVHFIGILLCILSGVLFSYLALKLLYDFIRGRKAKSKVTFILFMAFLILLGGGIGISVLEFTDITYTRALPEEIELKNDEQVIPMNDSLYVSDYYRVNFKEDDNLQNDVKIITSYYPMAHQVKTYIQDNQIGYFTYAKDEYRPGEFYEIIVADLKKKIIREYRDMRYITMTIYTSKENIAKIKENTEKYLAYLAEEQGYHQMLIELEQENYELKNEIYDLEIQIEVLKSEKQFLADELEQLKENITDILD